MTNRTKFKKGQKPWNKDMSNKIKLNCAICDKEIERCPSEIKSKKVFCSKGCASKYRMINDNPAKRPKVRKKISKNNWGRKNPKKAAKNLGKYAKKGNQAWNKGKKCPQISEGKKGFKHSKKSKKKISMTKTGEQRFTKFRSTERSRIMGSRKYKDWRSAVFERDKYTCQECGKSGCYIEAHHIRPFALFPKLRFDIDNGITYCLKCHIKKDKHRGKRGDKK